jgi:cell shape-determining protein MreC
MKRYSSTTKANYRHDSRKNYRFWLIVSALVIGAGLLFPWLISTVSAVVLYPFHVTTTWIKTGDGLLPIYLRSKASLVAEVESLRSKVSTEGGTQLSINLLTEENMQLRGMANASAAEGRLVARVLARPTQLPYDLLQIDRGTKDGVVVGAPVYTGVDSVVGIVSQAMENYSFVDLFTSPGFESTAFIFGPNVFSPLEGMGGGVARVRLPQGISIKEGQMVILPGVSSGIYGEIIRVENEATQPEQYGYVTPPLAMNNLLYVSVGLNSVQVKTEAVIDETIRKMLRDSLRLSSTTLYTYTSSTLPIIEEENSTNTESEL